MKKQNLSMSGGERAAARLDRDTWLNWSPERLARDYQLGHAIVRAVLAYPGVHPITKRVSMNVR
jgi:hypothetical protein